MTWRERARLLADILLVLAGAGVVAWYAPSLQRLALADDATLAAAFIIAYATFHLPIPVTSLLWLRKRESNPGFFVLEVPLIAFVFALFGWYATALLHVVAVVASARSVLGLFRRAQMAASWVVVWFALGFVRGLFGARVLENSVAGFAAFAAMLFLVHAFIVFVIFDVIIAVQTKRKLTEVWAVNARDAGLWGLIGLEIVWGWIATQIFLQGSPFLAVAVLVPVPFAALALRRIHADGVEIERLMATRDVLEAFVESGDPIPSLQRLLSSIQSDYFEQTLMIFGAVSPNSDEPLALARVGERLSAETDERVRAVVADLRAADAPQFLASPDGLLVYPVRERYSKAFIGAIAIFGVKMSLPAQYRDDLRHLAETLSALLTEIKSVLRQRQAASTDALTGITNRAGIQAIVESALERNAAFAVCLIDIDHFKWINDQKGHVEGDHCLRTVAQTIASHVRIDDFVGRIGGEEFLTYFPLANTATGFEMAERIRGAVMESGCRYADGQPLTVSIGIADHAGSAEARFEDVIRRADTALYHAKRSGRNRSVVYSEMLGEIVEKREPDPMTLERRRPSRVRRSRS